MNIALFYGGASGEHEVSCISARFVYSSLIQAGYQVNAIYVDRDSSWHLQKEFDIENPENNQINPAWFKSQKNQSAIITADKQVSVDFIFPMIHGTGGEDGALQGLAEFYRIPYAGASVMASALGMDKLYMRKIFREAGLPQVEYLHFENTEFETSHRDLIDRIDNKLSYPVFVKPCNMGSSVGVSKVNNQKELSIALQEAFSYDDHILVEQGHNVREVELAIIGNYDEYRVTDAAEIIVDAGFYSYAAKYLDKNSARLELPAKIEDTILKKLQKYARLAFAAIRGDGFARIDFFIDRDSGDVFINELNTLPGFTPISMFPRLWQHRGLDAAALVKELVTLGVQRADKKHNLKITRD